MYCTRCGIELVDQHFYCFKCGAATANAPRPVAPEPLYRSMFNRKIAGVCGGFAAWARMDATVVRVLWLLMTFGLPPAGIIGYIAAWIVMPLEPLPAQAPAQPAPAHGVV